MGGHPVSTPTAVEICLDDVEGAVVAEECGAARVEVCAALPEGGTTPSAGLLTAVLQRVRRLEVSVLVRPRAGDFAYSPAEVDVQLADIAAVRALPAPAGVRLGVVVGPLRPDGNVDTDVLARLVAAAGDLPVTFHKAFDTLPDLPRALETLVDAGVARVLTSGGAPTAAEGADVLADLVARADGRLEVVAGGGVRADHVAALVARTGVPAVHLRAQEPVPAAAAPSATAVRYDAPRLATAPGPVRAVVAALAGR
ncbi:CutC family protein [Kineococcus radiotolerans SRS30216 = ATCC BAA-149]|uniref:PF03932 family protein CutC n=1 Tax=Kineococcus radiotolerans (strain ATCC BAA-149 / DSM 14245 / SRS30216) TaxID=266940 RepID=A6W463_KINRD|nr:CutC family protein [Kineococcus radiotolerans SRS30216 = ATCC BAA-149]